MCHLLYTLVLVESSKICLYFFGGKSSYFAITGVQDGSNKHFGRQWCYAGCTETGSCRIFSELEYVREKQAEMVVEVLSEVKVNWEGRSEMNAPR